MANFADDEKAKYDQFIVTWVRFTLIQVGKHAHFYKWRLSKCQTTIEKGRKIILVGKETHVHSKKATKHENQSGRIL